MDDINKCESLLFGSSPKHKPRTRRPAPTLVIEPPQLKPSKRVKHKEPENSPPSEAVRTNSPVDDLAHAFSVPEDVARQYVTSYSVRDFYGRTAPPAQEDSDAVPDMWNSWAFPFRNKMLYGKLTIAGLSLPTRKEMLTIRPVMDFLQSRFLESPQSQLEVTDVATYVRTQLRNDSCTDAVLLIALWKLGAHDHTRWIHGTSVTSLPVRLQFIDNPRVFDSAISTHPTVTCTPSWLQRLCATAHTFYEASKRNGTWRCQFTGMETVVEAAFQYFNTVRAFVGRGGLVEDSTAGDIFRSCRPLKEKGVVDITDASFSVMRLTVEEYTNDFSWMFAAAYALAHSSIDGRVELVRKVVNTTRSWANVAVPTVPFTYGSDVDSSHEPSNMIEASCSVGFDALEWLLRDDARVWVTIRNRGAYYKELEFDSTRFAPLQVTDFMSRISHVELHGVFDALDQAVDEKNEDTAFVTASILLNLDVNSVYSFVDCKPRKQLRDLLTETLHDCPHVTCTHSNEVSFLSHASTSLWWWLFDQSSSHDMRRTMALVCELSTRYPDLEQLALWAAFVRCVGTWRPLSRMVADVSCDPVVGKLAGISGSAPIMEPIPEQDVCTINTLFRTEEVYARAYAALGTDQFLLYPKSTQQRAVVERLLLMGDWKSPECADAMFSVLYGSKLPLNVTIDPVLYHNLHTAFVRVINSTRHMSVLDANAVLAYIYIPRIIETIVQRFGNRVQWN